MRMVVGKHELASEGEFVHLVFRGELDLAGVEGVRAMCQGVMRAEGRCFILVDLRELSGITSEARRSVGEWRKADGAPATAAALFGASFAVRVLVTLMQNAVRLLQRAPLEPPARPGAGGAAGRRPLRGDGGEPRDRADLRRARAGARRRPLPAEPARGAALLPGDPRGAAPVSGRAP